MLPEAAEDVRAVDEVVVLRAFEGGGPSTAAFNLGETADPTIVVDGAAGSSAPLLFELSSRLMRSLGLLSSLAGGPAEAVSLVGEGSIGVDVGKTGAWVEGAPSPPVATA